MIKPSINSASTQRGVGLLEVLIALLVLAIGVLGFAGLQMTALSKSNDANHRAAAVLIAQDAIERIELNLSQREVYLDEDNWGDGAGLLGEAPDDECIGGETVCEPAELAEWDQSQLAWQAANQLPGGRILASDCEFNTRFTCVIVSWDEQDPDDCMDGSGIEQGKDSRCVVLEVAR